MILRADAAVGLEKPLRLPGVLECAVGDELLVYVPESRTAVTLNASARAVWDLCRGEAAISAIAVALGERFGLPGEALLPDVIDVVGKLRGFGLLKASDTRTT